MLIYFKVANYRSIGDAQILSLIPAPKQKEFSSNILSKGKNKALNLVAIYGANASGKSNFLRAMGIFSRMINISAKSSSTTNLPFDPFLLRKGFEKKPTLFELTFILDEFRYRYGFEYNESTIVSEWLFRKGKSREVLVFKRNHDVIEVTSAFTGSSKSKDAAIESTRDNALFLSTCDMLNVDEAKQIIKWFRFFNFIDGLSTEDEAIETVRLFGQEDYKQRIIDYFKQLNFNIEEIEITSKDFEISEIDEKLPEEIKSFLTKTLAGKKSLTVWVKHKLYDELGDPTSDMISWKLEERESAGTKKAFHLSGPVLWALANGGVLIIDEIEAKMHPIMTLHTIDIFLNSKTNPNNAQIVFATHDTNLLTYSELRRDQIYFVQKNKWESTELYSLSDFIYIGKKGVFSKSSKERPDSDKEKRYFEGRYGAVPFLGSFNPIKKKFNGKKR
jgi:hypothetical protein